MMKKTLYFGSVTLVLAISLISVSVANAQNVTTNASNAMGNASANANETAGNITNKTGEAGQKIGGILGNISEKIKEAIGTKYLTILFTIFLIFSRIIRLTCDGKYSFIKIL